MRALGTQPGPVGAQHLALAAEFHAGTAGVHPGGLDAAGNADALGHELDQRGVECVGVGLEPGKHTSFPRSVKLKKDEVVVFAWILYESKRARDRINAACLKDPRLADMADPKKHPFDAKRMFWGGFAAMVEL